MVYSRAAGKPRLDFLLSLVFFTCEFSDSWESSGKSGRATWLLSWRKTRNQINR